MASPNISIHAPTRGATRIIAVVQTRTIFQSTLLQEERQDGYFSDFFTRLFQSTLLQEERRFATFKILSGFLISIHAPTRGATTRNSIHRTTSYISIHAPTRGATASAFLRTTQRQYFNPRSYKRSDINKRFSKIRNCNFNPRSYKRSDIGDDKNEKLLCYFNPRSYKRSDPGKKNKVFLHTISIHAPTRGATKSCFNNETPFGISIHAPTRGATSTPIALLLLDKISIHAPTRGATRIIAVVQTWTIFQSTLLQEERPAQIITRNSIHNFNPRSYKRSDKSYIVRIAYVIQFQSTLLQEERRGFMDEYILDDNISIHAPTRGATLIDGAKSREENDFNPRSYKRSDNLCK